MFWGACAQNVNLGAVLSAVGINYAPCFFSSTPVGAFVGSTGMCAPAACHLRWSVACAVVSAWLCWFGIRALVMTSCMHRMCWCWLGGRTDAACLPWAAASGLLPAAARTIRVAVA